MVCGSGFEDSIPELETQLMLAIDSGCGMHQDTDGTLDLICDLRKMLNAKNADQDTALMEQDLLLLLLTHHSSLFHRR